MSATGDRRESGATLLEMLVVVGLMGLIAGVTFPSLQGALDHARLEHARADLVANLRLARAAAAREGHEIRVDLAADGASYGWEQTAVALPPGLKASAEREAMKFYVDGTSSGGVWTLGAKGRSLGVAVDPATGVVAPASAG